MNSEARPPSTTPESAIEIDTDAQPDASSTKEKPLQSPQSGSTAKDTAPLTPQTLTNNALHFLATASNETLGACLIGLGATTYFVLGRAGLLLIGVFGGVVLHASWENGIHKVTEDASGEVARKRKETGLEVIQRALEWRSRSGASNKELEDLMSPHEVDLYGGKPLDFGGFRPQTAAALTEIIDAVIRDYVKGWFSPLIPADVSFPSACRQTLTAFIIQVSNHISRKRPADTFLDFTTNASSIIIVFLTEISSALSGSPALSPEDAIEEYLSSKPQSSLANVLDATNQDQKLRLVAEDILQSFLDPKSYNCQPAHAFLREVLGNLILEMTIQRCSKPEWINQWIVYLLEDGEPELMNAIDAGVEGSAGKTLQNVKDGVAAYDNALGIGMPQGSDPARGRSSSTATKAQEAMNEALMEAKRLTQLIADEDARRLRDQQFSGTSSRDDVSENTATTQGIATPTSSQDDANADSDSQSLRHAPPDSPAEISPRTKEPHALGSSFTSFDQILPPNNVPTALQDIPERPGLDSAVFTLYNATISIFDDSLPNEKGIIRSKPTSDYLIQVEPKSSQHPGWMIARKYENFEVVHEVLKRISHISGVVGFSEGHSLVPQWKGHTKASLRGELERYVNDALQFKQLAESEGMRRFLEKDEALMRGSSSSKIGFGVFPAAFESMGKGMIDVITKAPKEVAGGSKALFGGVTGVLGNVGNLGQKRNNSTSSLPGRPLASPPASRASINPIHMRTESLVPLPSSRKSQDSLRAFSLVESQPSRVQQMERRPSCNPDTEAQPRPSTSSRSSTQVSRANSRAPSRAPSVRESMDLSPSFNGDQLLTIPSLPPLPSEIPDDYGSPTAITQNQGEQNVFAKPHSNDPLAPVALARPQTEQSPGVATKRPQSPSKSKPQLKEQETQVLIELMFAVINELYTLSSAWQIRKTLLTATKTFLLRPGNPQLESIRVLLQESLLDANASDEGIAAHLNKTRVNTLPTEEELKTWPAPIGDREKEELRKKARQLLIERGMPQALTSVMGQAASGEALGKVFDCLQIERVARGFMFALLLQAVRAIAQ